MTVLGGIWRLALFREAGFSAFANTAQAVLNALAPLLALPLVGGMLGVADGQGVAALTDLLATIVALLAPLVITHGFARFWSCEAVWPRYAAAMNWCQWVLPILAVPLMLVVALLSSAGASARLLLGLGLVALVVYGVSLHWFMARRGLGLNRRRTAILVAVTDLGTGVLVMLPRLLAGGLG